MLLFSLSILLFVTSCKNDSSTTENQPKSYQTTTPVQTFSVDVVYTDAQVYAGTTRFVFKDATGKIINVDIPNISKGEKIYLPGNLLENTNQGPPTANPKLLGKPFQLEYDRVSNKVIAVKPKKIEE